MTKAMFEIAHKAHKLPINPTAFIVDELSLTGDGIIHYIKREFPYAKIFALGDELQLKGHGVDDLVFTPILYDIVYNDDDFKIDYRASKCEKLQQLKVFIRKYMR